MVRLFWVCVLVVVVAVTGCGKSDDLPVTPTVGTIATAQGVVMRSDNYAPIAGVVVSIQGVRLTTGPDGTFEVSGLKPGTTLLTAERQGFQRFSGLVTLDGAVTYNFLMVPLGGDLSSAGG
jgi:hypothetical protein